MDIVEIKRFRLKPLKTNMSFYCSVFAKSELAYCSKYSDPYPHLAGIFAAKEAIIKCSQSPTRMIDIKIDHQADGRLVVTLKEEPTQIKISISHTESIAAAVAISDLT